MGNERVFTRVPSKVGYRREHEIRAGENVHQVRPSHGRPRIVGQRVGIPQIVDRERQSQVLDAGQAVQIAGRGGIGVRGVAARAPVLN